jgi:hypothetical protein
MLSLSHNNYFTTSGHGADWTVHLNPCTKIIYEDYTNESIQAASLIYENRTSPLTLLFSGGLDSEYMIRIFEKAKIPFDVAIITYGNYNSHDTKFAFDFCESHNIKPTVVDIDIEKFIQEGKIYEIAHTAKCCAYQMPSIMHGITKLDGTIIMANGEPYVKKYDDSWYWQETEKVNSYMNWYNINNIDGTPDFLRYTPEMTLSFLENPIIKEIVENNNLGKLSTRTSKHKLYSKEFSFIPRPKFTGWEELEKTKYYNLIQEEFDKLKNTYNGKFEIEYKQLIKSLKANR